MSKRVVGVLVDLGGVAVILLVSVLSGHQRAGAAPAARPEGSRMSTSAPSAAYPPGVTAILPSRSVADQHVAAFGSAEVEQFLTDNAAFFRSTPGGSRKLATILFITAAEARVRLNNTWIGRPDDALVCLVEVTGPIDLSHESRPAYLRHSFPLPLPPAPKGVAVFDAQTGNLLLTGYSN